MERNILSVVVASTILAHAFGYWINDLDHPCVRDCDAAPGPMTCSYDWTIESYFAMSRACYQCPFNINDCHRPHCVPMAGYARPIYSVNRKVPGTSIQVCEGDTIQVNVHNHLQNGESETIHWHGFHQRGSPFMDGVSAVTQCAIPSGQNFTYKFTANEPGTHWWHSHSGIHRADGLYGSLIVRQTSAADPHSFLYDIDDPNHVLIIAEWSKETSITIATGGQHGVAVQTNDGILINGRGTNQILVQDDGSTSTVDHHVVYAAAGLRYRFRVVGAVNDVCALTIAIDQHKLKIIAIDGTAVVPQDVDRLTVFSGERYDFVINTDQKVDSYWIRVSGELGCTQYQELAILRYDGAKRGVDPSPDKDIRPTGKVLNSRDAVRTPDSILIADLQDALPKEDDLSHVDNVHYLEFNSVNRNKAKGLHHPFFYPYRKAGEGTYTASFVNVINNITFAPTGVPLLTHSHLVDDSEWCNAESLRREGKDCSREACECIHRVDLPYNQVVELVFVNPRGIPHPMHLHGHYFNVVAMETKWNLFSIDDFKRLDAKGEIKRNLVDMPRKDTAMLPPSGYLVVRFRADNPGWWFLHCHFDTHLLSGMAMVFYVDGPLSAPPTNMPVCAP